MAKKIGLGVLALIIVFVIIVARQPATFSVERSAEIAAPQAVVFDLVADFKQFAIWSPWSKLDPAMKQTYSESTTGLGATYEWSGNDEVGGGKMTVTETQPPAIHTTRLDFTAPVTSTAMTGFKVEAAGEGTKVTWWMKGDNDFMGKAFGLFMDMDRMIGDSYETGLANVGTLAKAQVEARAKADTEARAQAAELAKAAAAARAKAEADAEAAAATAMAAAAEAMATAEAAAAASSRVK